MNLGGLALGPKQIEFNMPAPKPIWRQRSRNLAQRQIGALVVIGDPFFSNHQTQIVALAARYAIALLLAGAGLELVLW
jgi:hypothetical protein